MFIRLTAALQNSREPSRGPFTFRFELTAVHFSVLQDQAVVGGLLVGMPKEIINKLELVTQNDAKINNE